MANLCSNTLSVTPVSKNEEALKQFNKFVEDVKFAGEIVKAEDAEKFRKDYLEKQTGLRYRDDLNMFMKHSQMPILQFMIDACYFKLNKDGDFQKGERDFSMNEIHPFPKEYRETGENQEEKMLLRYGYATLRDWMVANWGTKSDAGEVDADFHPHLKTAHRVSYYFSTAWTPIVEFLININTKYPLLSFNLKYEESDSFKGEFEICNDELKKNKYVEL